MHRLEIQQAEIMRIAVQQEIQRSEVSRYDHRLHGILMVCSGFSCNQVAQMFGHSPRTVQYWVKRFEEIGFTGLEDIPRLGRPAKLNERLIELVGQDLRRSPRELGYSQNLWDGKLLSHHLSERFGVHIGVRQCQRLFHQLGFRRRKPRPLIAKADPEAQSKYKKTQKVGRKKKP